MKNKVVKWWPIEPTDGNIQYWDGQQWVVLSNGILDQVLTTHAISSGPTWEFLPGEAPSSSSSSSSGEGVGAENISFNATAANGGTGGGTGTNLFSAMTGDAHLTMGGDKDPILTADRSGTPQGLQGFPVNASWNFDDNGGANEIYFLCVESPITNKLSTIQYSQKTGPFPALCIGVITVKSEELNANSSTTPTGACTLISSTLTGNGTFDIVFDSSDDANITITGSYWDGSATQIINTSLLAGGTFTIQVNDIECIIAGDSRDSFVFLGLTPTIPPGKIWQAIAAAGGKFGGMWWDILNKIRCYSDGLEDTSGHPTLTALYGNPPPSSSSSSKHVSVLGIWGWFGNQTQTPGTSHFIPLNFDSPDPSMDVASEFLGVSRSTYESLSCSTTSVAIVNALAVTYNLLYANVGFWALLWLDPIFRFIDGLFPFVEPTECPVDPCPGGGSPCGGGGFGSTLEECFADHAAQNPGGCAGEGCEGSFPLGFLCIDVDPSGGFICGCCS